MMVNGFSLVKTFALWSVMVMRVTSKYIRHQLGNSVSKIWPQ